jgi:intraflagellar transport protein 88
MEGSPDFQIGYNLILCYYALGDTEKMKKGFIKLLSIEIPGEEEEEDEDPNYANDSLGEYIKEKRREAFKYIGDAAKLIANLIEDEWDQGYDWILEQLRAADFQVVESEIEIHKAV